MTDKQLKRIERLLQADPENEYLLAEKIRLKLRLGCAQYQDFIDPLLDRVVWNRTPEYLQDICIAAIADSLKSEWKHDYTKIFSCETTEAETKLSPTDKGVTITPTEKTVTYSHRIAVFKHQKTGLEFSLVPGGFLKPKPCYSCDGRAGVDLACYDCWGNGKISRSFRAFLVSRTLVTYNHWNKIAKDKRSPFSGSPKTLYNRPVNEINFEEATSWCNLANFELPRKDTWEYFARGGSAGNCFWVNSLSNDKLFLDRSHISIEIDSPLYNSFGLLDLFSNVQEWCTDIPRFSTHWNANYSDEDFRCVMGGYAMYDGQAEPAEYGSSATGIRPIFRLKNLDKTKKLQNEENYFSGH